MILNFGVVWAYRYLFLKGLGNTLLVSSVAMIFALLIGTTFAFCRVSPFKILRFVAACYVETIRNTPLLVQVYLVYFGIGQLISYRTIFWPSVTILAFFSGAFVSEIIRSGINAVPGGQREAALSIGMSNFQVARHIVLPQAFRRILPALAGQLVALVKASSLVSILAMVDLTFAATKVSMVTFRVLESYIVAAALYFSITFVLSQAIGFMERRMTRSSRL